MAGEPDPDTGYLIDLGVLQDLIDLYVIQPCDHRNLNLDVDFLKGIIPTSENLVKAFYDQLRDPVEKASATGAKLVSIRLYETERNIAEYRIM